MFLRLRTEQHFPVMEEVRFDSAFMFAYSPRERTYAARRLTDDVPARVKQQRLADMIVLQERHSRERFTAQVGRRVAVLIEGPAKSSPEQYFGRAADGKATVVTPCAEGGPAPGALITVEVTGASSHTLRARQVTGPA